MSIVDHLREIFDRKFLSFFLNIPERLQFVNSHSPIDSLQIINALIRAIFFLPKFPLFLLKGVKNIPLFFISGNHLAYSWKFNSFLFEFRIIRWQMLYIFFNFFERSLIWNNATYVFAYLYRFLKFIIYTFFIWLIFKPFRFYSYVMQIRFPSWFNAISIF